MLRLLHQQVLDRHVGDNHPSHFSSGRCQCIGVLHHEIHRRELCLPYCVHLHLQSGGERSAHRKGLSFEYGWFKL